MAIIKPFKAIRPVKDKAHLVASRPYDVLNSEEAGIEAQGNRCSILHDSKAEIDLPADTDHYDMIVYKKAKENFEKMLNEKIFMQDEQDCLYIYAQTMNGKTQYGLVACASVNDYFNNVIKKHELTRHEKEKDRMTHIDVTNMNAEPVFLTYHDVPGINSIVDEIIKTKPEYDFTSVDGIQHTLWVINEVEKINCLTRLFSEIPYTYIADGHHRTASAALVGKARMEANADHSGNEKYNYLMAVHFPASQLNIIDYNRVIKDLNGISPNEFILKLKANFIVEKKGNKPCKPHHMHDFGMYLNKKWYLLTAREGTYDEHDPVGVLDVSILSENILKPLLDIKDLRTDKRIDFVGGIRGLEELSRRVDSGEMSIAFALFPVTVQQLINIADTNNIMPPKTTWFEPKLRSGLVIYKIK